VENIFSLLVYEIISSTTNNMATVAATAPTRGRGHNGFGRGGGGGGRGGRGGGASSTSSSQRRGGTSGSSSRTNNSHNVPLTSSGSALSSKPPPMVMTAAQLWANQRSSSAETQPRGSKKRDEEDDDSDDDYFFSSSDEDEDEDDVKEGPRKKLSRAEMALEGEKLFKSCVSTYMELLGEGNTQKKVQVICPSTSVSSASACLCVSGLLFTSSLSHLISSHLISSHLISSHLISSHQQPTNDQSIEGSSNSNQLERTLEQIKLAKKEVRHLSCS